MLTIVIHPVGNGFLKGQPADSDFLMIPLAILCVATLVCTGLRREAELTVLLVTHDLPLVRKHAQSAEFPS